MPEISRFHGIVIKMYYSDHEAAHFHAWYGEYRMSVRLSNGASSGRFPPRARRRVLTWYQRHRAALWQNWWRTRARQPPLPVPPSM
jgi:hypothetical protein